MKKGTNQFDFDTPLTKRGFLLFYTRNKIEPETKTGDGELSYPLFIISAIFKLYGANIVHIHSGFSKAFSAKLNTRDNSLSPHIFFEYKDKPLYQFDGEFGLKRKLLKDMDHTSWYPFHWLGIDGDKLNEEFDKAKSKLRKLKSFQNWEIKNNHLNKLVETWQNEFLKDYTKHSGYSLKFYNYDGTTTVSLTVIKNKDSQTKNSKKIFDENVIKLEIFQDFAKYLFGGFLNKNTKFPKCLYE